MLGRATRQLNYQRIYWQKALLRNKDVLCPLVQVREITTNDFLKSGNFAYTKELGRELTESIMAKYFESDGFRSVAQKLSPQTIATMVDELTASDEKIDYATLEMLVDQAVLSGTESSAIVEKIMNFYISRGNVVAAANVLRKCHSDTISISQKMCTRLISRLVENLNWNHTFIAAMYMVSRDYVFPPDAMFQLMGGLMKDSAGVGKALELMKVITIKKRADLTTQFSFNMVNRFSQSMSYHNTPMFYRKPIDRARFEEVFAVALAQIKQSGWFTYSQVKMLVSLSISANHSELAADFVRQATMALTQWEKAQAALNKNNYNSKSHSSKRGKNFEEEDKSDEDKNDLLSMLKSFSQGDAVAQREFSNAPLYNSVTLTLLELCWKQPFLDQLQRQGPMKASTLLGMHWVLAYRARNLVVDLPAYSKNVPLSVLDEVHAEAQSLYDQLMDFYSDDRAQSVEISVKPGFERRTLRVLSDAFGFNHIAVDPTATATYNNNSTTTSTATPSTASPTNNNTNSTLAESTVRISKPSMNDSFSGKSTNTQYIQVAPPSLMELIRLDNLNDPQNRQFDGKPLYFSQLTSFLDSLEMEKVTVAIGKTINNMQFYPSLSWVLLLVEYLQSRKIPLPLGTLRHGVKMCNERADLYGLLELLHAANTEQLLSTDEVYLKNLRLLRHKNKYQRNIDLSNYMDPETLSQYYQNTGAAEEEEVNREEKDHLQTRLIDRLNFVDWNKACRYAFRSTYNTVPGNSKNTAFAEMMVLMNRCAVHLQFDTVTVLLDFLVSTNRNSEHLWKIIKRICVDEEIAVTHNQCISLTKLLVNRLAPQNRILKVARDASLNKNYMYVFPNTLHQISDMVLEHNGRKNLLGFDFKKQFLTHWPNLHTREGREGLYTMLETSMNQDIHLTLSKPDHAAAREAYTLLCMYTAYLISTHDDECRRAFILLASAERLYHVVDENGNVSYTHYSYPANEPDTYIRRHSVGGGSNRTRDAQLSQDRYNNNNNNNNNSSGNSSRGRNGKRNAASDDERFVKYLKEHEYDGYESDR